MPRSRGRPCGRSGRSGRWRGRRRAGRWGRGGRRGGGGVEGLGGGGGGGGGGGVGGGVGAGGLYGDHVIDALRDVGRKFHLAEGDFVAFEEADAAGGDGEDAVGLALLEGADQGFDV